MRVIGMSAGEAMESRAAQDVAGSLFLNVTGRLLQIGLAILMARILPLKEFGLFTLVMSWVMVLIVPSMVGAQPFLQREIAVAKSREQWARVKSLLRWSTLTTFLVSCIVFIAASCWILITIPSENPDRYTFLIGFILVPLTALLQLWQAHLRGWGAILAGQIPGTVIQRLLFGILLLAGLAFFASVGMNATVALVMQSVATVSALGVTALLKFRYLQVPRAERSKPETWTWLRLSSRFTLLSGLVMLNSQLGILMVGAMLGKADTGIFAVAVKGADLLTVAFLAASMALAPRMAAFYSDEKYEKLQLMLTRTYRVVSLVTFPVFLLFVFDGNIFLNIFGPAFTAAWPALIILSFGQFFSILSGPTGTMLSMAGHERLTMIGVGISVVVNVLGNVILIPLMGIYGAALGTALGVIIWNVVLVIFCYKRLGIWTPVLGASLFGRMSGDKG